MRISDWSSDVCSSDLTISIYSRDAFLEKSGAPRGDGRQIPAFVPFRVADLAFLRLHRAKKGAWQRTRFRSHCLCRLPGLWWRPVFSSISMARWLSLSSEIGRAHV